MYICLLDNYRVLQKHKNPMQSTKFSSSGGWFKGHFEISILCTMASRRRTLYQNEVKESND